MDPQPIQPEPAQNPPPENAKPDPDTKWFVDSLSKIIDHKMPIKQNPPWEFSDSIEGYIKTPDSAITPWSKKKKKQEPEAPVSEAQKALDERKSVFGQSFKGGLESDWINYEGAGWVHANEAYLFSRNYAQCCLTNKWMGRQSMACAMGEKLVGIDAAEAAGWVVCAYSGNMVDPKETFKACNRVGEPINVGLQYKGEYITCSATGVLIQDSDGVTIYKSKKHKKVIPSCLKTHFSQCQKCERWFEKTMVEPREECSNLRLCSECYVKNLHSGQILAYNDHSHPAEMFDVTERRAAELLMGEIVSGCMEKVSSHRLFGVELETEFDKPSMVKLKLNRFQMAIEFKKAIGKDFISIKEDGTLLMNGHYNNSAKDPTKNQPGGEVYAGFEVITAPAAMRFHRDRWPKIETMPHFKVLRAWDTETCGLHVHVSRSSLNQLQIGRMLRFVNHPSNAKFIQKMAGRGCGRWWRYIEKNVVDIIHPERVCSPEETNAHDRARRVALNIKNANTVEFRIFRGTVNPRHIIRNIEFCDAVCDFCWPATRSLSEMDNYGNFIAYVGKNRKRWPMLAAWFVYQKQLTLKKIGEGADPSKFTIKPEMVEEPEPKIIQQENSAAVQETVAS